MKSLRLCIGDFFLFSMLETILHKTPGFYKNYIQQIDEDNFIDALAHQEFVIKSFFKTLNFDQLHYKYAAGKWSIAEVLQHCIDTERIMSYRALCIARGEQQPLFGYDEDAYTEQCNADLRKGDDLRKDWVFTRKSTLFLFKSFNSSQLLASGEVDGKNMSVDSLGAIICGHSKHHLKVLKNKYL